MDKRQVRIINKQGVLIGVGKLRYVNTGEGHGYNCMVQCEPPVELTIFSHQYTEHFYFLLPSGHYHVWGCGHSEPDDQIQIHPEDLHDILVWHPQESFRG